MKIRGGLLFLVILSAFLLLVSAKSGFAGSYDPKLEYQTIDTKHFSIHYPAYLNEVAQKVAVISEDAFQYLSPKFEWVPWGRTQMVLTDESDFANGMATVLPYNWLFIRVTAADANSSLGDYDNWLRMLIMHEYTHIMHLDKWKGFWAPIRYVFGKTVSPNGITPGWIKEGLAVFEETITTKGGRGRAAYSEMLVRTAILQDKFLSIDHANGDQWEWPGMNARYIYGIKFLEYLGETYGEDKLYEFVERVSGSPFLAAINRQARWVFSDIELETYKVHNRYAKKKKPGTSRSKTYYTLWNEWKDYLKKRYKAEAEELEKEGLTKLEVVMDSKKASLASPTVSPDGKKIIYNSYSPYGPSALMIADIDGSNAKKLLKGTFVSQASFSRDGKFFVYAKAAKYKRYQFIYDLYKYDFDTKKTKRLTKGKRAKDPDLSPDGSEIVCVTQNAGTSRLELYNMGTEGLSPIPNDFPQFTQFSNPRFSPDGSKIAVAVAVPGSVWDIFIFNKKGKVVARVTDDLELEDDPVWGSEGEWLYYVSDRSGIANVYKYNLKNKKKEKVTNVLTGVATPFLIPGSGEMVVQYYNGDGYDIRKGSIGGVPLKKGKAFRSTYFDRAAIKDGLLSSDEAQGASGIARFSDLPFAETNDAKGLNYDPAIFDSKKYSPFKGSLLVPRFITPYGAVLDDALLFSFLTGGADPLRWHNWIGGVTYRTDSKHVGYFFRYWYNRFKPIINAGVMDYSVEFGLLTFVFDDNGDGIVDRRRTVHLFEKRLRGYGGIAYPIDQHAVSLNYFYENREADTPLTPAEINVLNLGVYAGLSLGYGYNDSKKYAASISREGGRQARMSFTVTNSIFGSAQKNEQYIFAGDFREYINTWGRQVIALKLAGGMTWGDKLVQGTFSLGGSMGEGTLAGQGSLYYFFLRGLPVATLSRDRAMLMSGEYRFPLITAQRGLGTLPFFLRDFHVAAFADYGNAWNANESTGGYFFNNFFLGTGLELRGDFVIGYGLPVTGRIGYGIIVVNRDRIRNVRDPIFDHSAEDGVFILQLGTSF